MKKCLLFFVALMFATVARGADGDTFTVDGLHYEIISEEEHTVSVFCFNNPYRSISIPSYVSNGSSRYIVTEIGSFQDSQNMTTIGIPETVTEIHDGAFFGCSSLRGIIIPATVTKIGKGAFANCSSMQMIRFNGDNPNYSSENGVLFNIDKTVLIQFPGAKSGSYTIPETVTKIESWAFCGGGNLTSVTIPKSVTEIGQYAFAFCYNLTSVDIPGSVTEIGVCTFRGCINMKTITLPASLTKIGEGAFSACYALQSVTIPEGVTEIGPYAFQECYYLTSVLLPTSLIKIEDGAFHKCYSLTSVTIPAAVTEIGNYALQDCNGLTWIDVEKGNQNYASENGALFNIDKTTLIKCPAGITGEYAIPASVTEIESCAFAACQNLAWIAIPRSVTKIGDSAFEYCSNLKTIYNLNPTPQTLGEKAFDGVPEDAVVYIPQGSYKSYYLSWGYFSDFREMGALDIALSKQTLDLKTGDTATITITVTKDDDVTIESEEWSSSNPEVATVDNGIIAAVAPGEAVIWYTAVDGNAVPHTESCKVTVVENSGVTEVVNDADTSIEVFNLQGVAVLRNASTTELRNLPAGIYIVRKGTSVKKIVVK